jgi:hypothetical protein
VFRQARHNVGNISHGKLLEESCRERRPKQRLIEFSLARLSHQTRQSGRGIETCHKRVPSGSKPATMPPRFFLIYGGAIDIGWCCTPNTSHVVRATFSDFEPAPNSTGMQTRVGKLYNFSSDQCQVFRAHQPKSISYYAWHDYCCRAIAKPFCNRQQPGLVPPAVTFTGEFPSCAFYSLPLQSRRCR